MRLTILHLTPSLEGGGAERQLSLLVAEQARRGCIVHVGIRRGGVYETSVRRSAVTVHTLGDHKGPSPILLTKIDALIRQTRPNVVQTWLPQMDVLGGFAALRNSVAWILSERSSHLGFRRFAFLDWTRSRLARHARAIVANSMGGSAYWRAQLGCAVPIFRISNAIDFDGIHAAMSTSKEGADVGPQRLLVVGRLAPEKALDVVIESLRQVPASVDFHVSIVGDGPLRAAVQGMIDAAGLGRRCTVLPFLADWWRMLSGAAALLSMSTFEGQPNVILEAMAAGCPLIVSDIPAHREVLDDDSATFVPSGNATALAAAVAAVLADQESARRRAARAVQRIAGLTIEAAATAYDSVYQQLLAGTMPKCAES